MSENFEYHLERAGEKAKEKPPSRIEIISGKDKEILDLVVHEGPKNFSLKEYIPAQVAIGNGKMFAYQQEKKILELRENDLGVAFGRIALLHEIGHAVDYDKHPERLVEGRQYDDTRKEIAMARIEALFEEDVETTSKLSENERLSVLGKKIAQKLNELNLEPDRIKNYIDFLAKIERTAHAEGLKLYRQIKKEKEIDLFAGLKNEEIKELAHYTLKSYDDAYRFFYPEERLKLFLARQAEE